MKMETKLSELEKEMISTMMDIIEEGNWNEFIAKMESRGNEEGECEIDEAFGKLMKKL